MLYHFKINKKGVAFLHFFSTNKICKKAFSIFVEMTIGNLNCYNIPTSFLSNTRPKNKLSFNKNFDCAVFAEASYTMRNLFLFLSVISCIVFLLLLYVFLTCSIIFCFNCFCIMLSYLLRVSFCSFNVRIFNFNQPKLKA